MRYAGSAGHAPMREFTPEQPPVGSCGPIGENQGMTSQNFSRPGAIDLSALKGQAGNAASSAGGQSQPAGQAGTGGGGFVVDVTEQNFQAEVVERSSSVPVVIDFWAEWCGPCKQLGPVLERLAGEYAGSFVLAKVDVDQNQRIAQAAGVQSIPLVVAVVGGQLVPLFQGAVPEAQVRQYLDELLRVAAANGVTGQAEPVGGEPEADQDEAEPARDPRYAEADRALENGDIDAAINAYEKLLEQSPADATAKAGLAQSRLLSRTRDLQVSQVRATAADNPHDVAAQCAVADLDVLGGHVDDAFARLIDTIRQVAGPEREAARVHLLELFEVVGTEDSRVRKARQLLSTALF